MLDAVWPCRWIRLKSMNHYFTLLPGGDEGGLNDLAFCNGAEWPVHQTSVSAWKCFSGPDRVCTTQQHHALCM